MPPEFVHTQLSNISPDMDKLSTLNETDCPGQLGQNGQLLYTEITSDISSENSFINGAFSKNKNAHSNNLEVNMKLVNNIVTTKYDDLTEYVKKLINNVIEYFLESYSYSLLKPHPILKKDYWERVINDLFINPVAVFAQDLDYDQFEAIIDNYFETDFQTVDVDYNILHFATMGVQDNRFFDAGLY